jgi:hypothetical protein
MTGMLESDAVVISDEWAINRWPKQSRVPLHIPGALNGRYRRLAMDVPVPTMSRERLSQALPDGFAGSLGRSRRCVRIVSPPQRCAHLRHRLQMVRVIAGEAQHEIRSTGASETVEPFRDA